MHERELERKHSESRANADLDLTPGRASASANLTRREQPLASGILMRKGTGEASADAESAVATAASSSGQALPGELRERFESSLGTDLSGVRVHTGAESQEAAQSVSARAYTVGNDIHFGAGHYDPASTGGQQLLAHEVAHTVQQRGGTTTRQNKLEVSQAGDSFEVEADRAAEAMVTGAPAQVSSLGGGGLVQRDPDRNPLTQEPVLPRPLYWAGDSVDGEITGAWSSQPQFSVIAVGGMSPAGLEWVNRVDNAKQAFTAVWGQAQATWNGAVPVAKEYRDAAQDAENKGLADFGGKGSDIDLDAQGEDFGGKQSVSDAYQGNDKAEAGDKTFNRAKVDPALKRKIADEKQAVVVAGRLVDGSEREIDDARLDLDTAKLEVENAVTGIKAKEDAKEIKQLNIQIEAYKRSMGLMNTAIGGMVKAAPTPAAALEAGSVGLQMLNTHLWETSILQVEGQIQVLEGAAAQSEIIGAENMAKIAKNNMRKAVNRVRTAIDNYKTKCGEWKKAHAALAESLEKAATQSSGNPKVGEKVRAAVEAIPLMELTLTKCQALLAKVNPPAENRDATIGGGMCANPSEFTQRVGILTMWRGEMSAATVKWQKRLTTAKQLVAQAQ